MLSKGDYVRIPWGFVALVCDQEATNTFTSIPWASKTAREGADDDAEELVTQALIKHSRKNSETEPWSELKAPLENMLKGTD